MAEKAPFDTVLQGMNRIAERARTDGLPVGTVRNVVNRYLERSGYTVDEYKAARSGASNSLAGPLAQGLTFGYADELRGLGGALVDTVRDGANFSDAYDQNVTRERNSLEAYRNDNPVTATAAELAGGVVPTVLGTLATGGASLPLTLGQVAGRGALTGALGGALYGSGQGEGLTDRAMRATIGGGIGAAVGGLAPVAIQGGKAAARQIGLQFQPEKAADYVVARAMQRDKVTPQQVSERVADAANRGVPLTPADVGGANMQGLADLVANAPGEGLEIAKKQLEGRQMMGLARITRTVSKAFGTPRKAIDAVAASEAAQKKAADPLYEAARAVPVPDDVFARFAIETTQGPGKDAFTSSRKILQGRYGKRNIKQMPRLAAIDAWKQAMDDQVGTYIRAGQKNAASATIQQRNRVLEMIDAAVPEYPVAREVYAGPAAFQNAIEEGQKITNRQYAPEELAAWWAKATKSEKDGFRIGAGSQINALLGEDGAKLPDLSKYFRKPNLMRKVEILIEDPKQIENFRANIGMEGAASETLAATKNSRTAYRTAAREDADDMGIVPETLRAIWESSSGIFNTGAKLTGFVGRRVADKLNARRNAEIARIVLETDADKALKTLGRFENRALPAPPSPAFGGIGGGLSGGSAAGAVPINQQRQELPY